MWSGDSCERFLSIAPVVTLRRSSTDCPDAWLTKLSQELSESRGVGGVKLIFEYWVVASTLVSTRITFQASSLFFAQRPMIQKSSKLMFLFALALGSAAKPNLNAL